MSDYFETLAAAHVALDNAKRLLAEHERVCPSTADYISTRNALKGEISRRAAAIRWLMERRAESDDAA
jgi:hypothetical protein